MIMILGSEIENYFIIDYKFDHSTFREIHLLKAYDLNSLVGNVGGYIGMFLGYAFLHLPSLFAIAFQNTRKWIQQKKANNSNTEIHEKEQKEERFLV